MTCRLGMGPLHTESPGVLAAALSLQYACLVLRTASPAVHLICPLAQFAFGFFFVTKPMLMDWRIGTLKSNVPGPEANKEGFHCVRTAVLQLEFTCKQQQECPWSLLPKTGDTHTCNSLPAAVIILCSRDT